MISFKNKGRKLYCNTTKYIVITQFNYLKIGNDITSDFVMYLEHVPREKDNSVFCPLEE